MDTPQPLERVRRTVERAARGPVRVAERASRGPVRAAEHAAARLTGDRADVRSSTAPAPTGPVHGGPTGPRWTPDEPEELQALRHADVTTHPRTDRAERAARTASAYLEARRQRLRRELDEAQG